MTLEIPEADVFTHNSFSLFSFVLILIASGAAAQSAPVFSAGDVPRAALDALPGARAGETHGATYRFGLLASAEEWARLRTSVVDSRFGEFEWGPDLAAEQLDWQRHRVVYVAFDGATRLLSLEEVRERAGGIVELVFVARPSRRREAPDGPCSLLLWRGEVGAVETVRLVERAPDGGEAELGELTVSRP